MAELDVKRRKALEITGIIRSDLSYDKLLRYAVKAIIEANYVWKNMEWVKEEDTLKTPGEVYNFVIKQQREERKTVCDCLDNRQA